MSDRPDEPNRLGGTNPARVYRTNPARVRMGDEIQMTERTREPGMEGDTVRSGYGWWIVLLICAALLGWGLIQYATIRDEPRRWDFDVQPDAPGESEASTTRPDLRAPAPPQIEPLPEARRAAGEAATGASAQAHTRPTNGGRP